MSQDTAFQTRTSTRTTQSGRSQRIRQVRAAGGLSPAEKLLLRSLVDFMGQSTECWPSLARLAAEVGITTRQVRRLLRSLESAGWISSRPRFRADGGQTSTVYQWSAPPDICVRPPRTSVSAHETYELKEQENKQHAAEAECDLNGRESPAVVEVKPDDFQPAAAPIGESLRRLTAARSVPAPAVSERPKPKPAPERHRPAFIRIDGSQFTDIREAGRVYQAAVSGKLLNSGTADRLRFFACWCAIAQKFRAGKIRNPAASMRWLMANPRVMSAYPDQSAEDKARAVIRKLFPERPYVPHG